MSEFISDPERRLGVKEDALEFLWASTNLTEEMEGMLSQGYEISIGSSEDGAYERPEKIFEIFGRLHDGGVELSRRSRPFAFGSAAFASIVDIPPASMKGVIIRSSGPLYGRSRIQDAREQLRREILYDQDDVQALAWHEQNGKATSLATIVSAHDLSVEGCGDGVYELMGGKLTPSLLNHRFSEEHGRVSDSIAGMSVYDAHISTGSEFRGKTPEEAALAASRDFTKLSRFLEAPVQVGFKEIVQYCTDSLGIRSRQQELRQRILEHTETLDKDELLMMSVGCGTAQPVLEVMAELRARGQDSRMILVDQDPIALAAAEQIAQELGLEDSVEIHCTKLFVKDGLSLKMTDLQEILRGRELDVCEDSGLREYFPDSMYKDLTGQAWDALAPGGLMSTGNMNKNRPQPEFLHGLMGWPIPVKMRYMKDLARLHQEAGVPREASKFRITQDGVYTLCFSTKPTA